MKYIFLIFLLLQGVVHQADKSYLLGQFDPEQDQRFVRPAGEYTAGAATTQLLRRETYDAFVRMAQAARKDSISLIIISATRNFDIQKRIWENKWTGKVAVEGIKLTTIPDPAARAKMILRYSSMPGTSRHHWGTDMDLNSLDNSYFDSGEGLRLYQWLQRHGQEYGFCQPYTSKRGGRTGYEEEKWHWSYLPLSGPLLERYLREVHAEDIRGFEGAPTAGALHVIEQYVGGVGCSFVY